MAEGYWKGYYIKFFLWQRGAKAGVTKIPIFVCYKVNGLLLMIYLLAHIVWKYGLCLAELWNLFQNSKHKLILMLLELNGLFYMLHKDNIVSTRISEAVEKIPTDEKDYC